ncbi:hypothetical protein MSG28_005760 [Choristoneura fumiferana]|uniref:Uncharacterized protein n=1 Tax=Choristoneura fumiferana TaxID=7141 RepID=A0ACC0KZY7_CHOFU|nr:hypothetical protein MSG28_005760 [Choristoneura fumiferana]
MEQVFYENTNRHTFASSCYDIVLKPAVKMQNCLPVDIVVSQLGLKRTQTFKPGEMFHLSHLSPNKASIVVMIQNYLDKCWVCTKNLPDTETELSVWSFESHDSPSVMTLDLGMHSAEMEGTQVLSLYCPFWMLNKTGLTLCYRNVDETGNVIFHPKEYKEPILFSFRAKNFFGKKKAAIRIGFGEWSDKFSLDVPGSSGVVEKNSSAPLWPIVEKEEKLLLLRVLGSSDYGGLYVEVQLSEGGTYITVRQYRDGHAPALVVNYCPYTITVYEKENINVK